MQDKINRRKWRATGLFALVLGGLATSGNAASAPTSTLWTTVCQSCHQGNAAPGYVATPSTPRPSASYPAILSSSVRTSYDSWLDSAQHLDAHIAAVSTPVSTMKFYYDNYIVGHTSDVEELRLFLLAALDAYADSTSLNFGTTDLNVETNRLVTITNLRASNLTVHAGSVTVSDTANYVIKTGSATTCTNNAVLAPGGSCVVSVSFLPTSAGSKSATLQLQLDPDGGDPPPNPTLISLAGTANPPPPTPTPQLLFGLSPTPTDLLARPVGESSTAEITLSNIGTASIDLLTVTKSGASASDYAFTENCSTSPPAQGGLQTCKIQITFTPSALGVREGSLTIAYSGGAPVQNLTLPIVLNFKGIVPPTPTASLTASTEFGSQGVGNVYPPRRLVYANTGIVSISKIAVSVSGTGFSIASPACPTTLAPGAKCNIDVQFTPAQADTNYTGSVSVASNAENAPHQATLTGRGVNEPTPVLSWSAPGNLIDFGAVAVGSTKELTVTLTNPGPAAVILRVANILGANGQSFLVTPQNCQFNDYLTAGQSCQFKLTFQPSSSGTKTADVQAGTTGSAPGLLTVTGLGLGGPEPRVGLSSSTLAFEPTRVGSSSAPQVITLRSNGSSALQVTGISVGGAFTISSQTCTAPPFTLAPGFDCSVSVDFKPTSEGQMQGTLKIITNAADTPELSIALSGQADAAPKTSGGGGCSMARGDSPLDPTLWLLAAGAVGVLLWRGRERSRRTAANDGRRAA